MPRNIIAIDSGSVRTSWGIMKTLSNKSIRSFPLTIRQDQQMEDIFNTQTSASLSPGVWDVVVTVTFLSFSGVGVTATFLSLDSLKGMSIYIARSVVSLRLAGALAGTVVGETILERAMTCRCFLSTQRGSKGMALRRGLYCL